MVPVGPAAEPAAVVGEHGIDLVGVRLDGRGHPTRLAAARQATRELAPLGRWLEHGSVALTMRPTIYLFADVLGGFGGIESYLDALARRLHADNWSVRVAVSLNGPAPFLDDLEALGIDVYRQPRVLGDRWNVRQRLLVRRVAKRVKPGDWVYCVRQPMPGVYLLLVRAVHARGGKVAASWAFAPEFVPAPPGRAGGAFKHAVAETDTVISVSECTRGQFAEMYGYRGPVAVVRYHNVELLHEVVPLPASPPFRIGFMGRIDIKQKNLDSILEAAKLLLARRDDVIFNLHGGGADFGRLDALVAAAGLGGRVVLHGRYDHRRDLPTIIGSNHLFLYTSRFEGGPCFSLLELLQAGRYVVASPVGGIPDIYQGRSEIGTLVDAGNPEAIAGALEDAIARLSANRIDSQRIRAVYTEHFHESVAHVQFLTALGILHLSDSPSRPFALAEPLRARPSAILTP